MGFIATTLPALSIGPVDSALGGVKLLTLKHKVYAYITYGRRLLVFAHPNAPEAGIQVPGGTVGEGEDPEVAVLREAWEETGLRRLELHAFLGECDFPVPAWGQMHRRRFYHLICPGRPPERWRHLEMNPSDRTQEPIPFELYWVRLPTGVPELAPGHGAMLPKLMRVMRMRNL